MNSNTKTKMKSKLLFTLLAALAFSPMANAADYGSVLVLNSNGTVRASVPVSSNFWNVLLATIGSNSPGGSTLTVGTNAFRPAWIDSQANVISSANTNSATVLSNLAARLGPLIFGDPTGTNLVTFLRAMAANGAVMNANMSGSESLVELTSPANGYAEVSAKNGLYIKCFSRLFYFSQGGDISPYYGITNGTLGHGYQPWDYVYANHVVSGGEPVATIANVSSMLSAAVWNTVYSTNLSAFAPKIPVSGSGPTFSGNCVTGATLALTPAQLWSPPNNPAVVSNAIYAFYADTNWTDGYALSWGSATNYFIPFGTPTNSWFYPLTAASNIYGFASFSGVGMVLTNALVGGGSTWHFVTAQDGPDNVSGLYALGYRDGDILTLTGISGGASPIPGTITAAQIQLAFDEGGDFTSWSLYTAGSYSVNPWQGSTVTFTTSGGSGDDSATFTITTSACTSQP